MSNTHSSRTPSRRYASATTLMVLPTQKRPITSLLLCPSFHLIRGSGKGKHKRDSIYAGDGTIFTGYYSNFMSFLKEECDMVIDEREHKNGKKNDKRDTKRKLSELQSLMEDITMMKRTVSQLIITKPGNHGEEDKEVPRNDAGNCFGG